MSDLSMNDVIELNVGGVRFVTLRKTLCADPQSTLFTMFTTNEGPSLPKDKNGLIFLDIDPEIFAVILDHLRNVRRSGKAVVGPLSLQGVYGSAENRWSKQCLANACAELGIACAF